ASEGITVVKIPPRTPRAPTPSPNRTDLAVLRIVVRNGFTHDLADLLLADLRTELPRLGRQLSTAREN
ncbi:MAG TPA: hypothetical protein VE400_23755, partial [Mycobacterium sp.]|nr:hypothetical protein [Mycobacterium sp.]